LLSSPKPQLSFEWQAKLKLSFVIRLSSKAPNASSYQQLKCTISMTVSSGSKPSNQIE
jgi:hypothetical protein